MRNMISTYNTVVTAAIALVIVLAGAVASASDLDELFTRLADPQEPDWQRVESQIERQLNLSGSASADLLLRRGQQALDAGDFEAAIDHLTALTDHAPEFAEGWNTRAAAYFGAGLYGPAINDLRQVLALEPRHYGALAGLGMILEEIGNQEAALAAYQRAAAIHPHLASLQAAVDRLQHAAGGTAL
ncbi:tetratricopeptide repeat protein [Nioella nitratireducens]|uniref:tetratricopeptide repeat protein n=1 Tax=Nioella nitratireducens TaxID=1287720 RepID=UPI0008FD6D0B|nr:tetratricopeptide repeat protein [Nioella nitratireducens]